MNLFRNCKLTNLNLFVDTLLQIKFLRQYIFIKTNDCYKQKNEASAC